MQEQLSYFLGINLFHWGTNWYQWFFYAGLILVIIFEKDKIAKTIFGLYPIAYVLAIFTPVFNHVLHLVWPRASSNAYYARLFSFIPLFFCITLGLMQLVRKIKWEWMKLLMVCAVSTLIIIGGDDFYKAAWMTKATNIEKIPDGTTEVVEILKKERQIISVASVDPLNVYIRQIDANLITPYGRYMNELGHSLSQSVPNVSYVMKEAGRESVDFLVVHNNLECKESFRVGGYEPYAETEKYLIYKVSNVPYVKRTYNEKRLIIAETTCDKDDNPIENEKGYATIAYEYNEYGLRAKETYLDKNGDKILLGGSYASIQRTYFRVSHLIQSIIYLDTNGDKVLVDGRYETRYQYDGERRLIRESYYDQNGEICNRIDEGYAIKELEYDKKGNITHERFLNQQGERCLVNILYSERIRTYTESGKVASIQYLDENAEIKSILGRFQTKYEYDSAGNLIKECFYDKDGRMMNRSDDCYAVRNIDYDSSNRIIGEHYYDADMQPVMINAGYSSYQIQYEDDVISSVIYYDNKGAILSGIGKNYETEGSMFIHFTDSICFTEDGTTKLVTQMPDNRFNYVFFRAYDATSGEQVCSIMSTGKTGEYNGVYKHESSPGMIRFVLKGNGKHRDECLSVYRYFDTGETLNYCFTITELDSHIIIIKDLICEKGK